MNRIYEIITVLLLCLIGLGQSGSFIAPVAVFLVTVVIALLTQIFTGRWPAVILIFLLSLSCAWLPMVFCMVPLITYLAMEEKRWYLTTPALLVFRTLSVVPPREDGTSVRAGLAGITDPLTFSQYMIAIVGILISIILFLRFSRLEEANKKLRLLRDEIAEKNEKLRVQNDRLTNAQDNEVHLATMKERNRIAREIHDNVGHMLTRSLLQVGALLVATPEDAPAHESLEGLRDTLDQAMTSVRESVHDLHDESIDLRAVIEESIKPAENEFEVTIEYDLPDSLSPKTRLGMAGIVREAISNSIRHSNGDKLRIAAVEHPGYYALTIQDNGKTMNSRAASITDFHTGIGLQTMEERAQELGGKISIEREDGFVVNLTVPK